ncbi:heat-shock protein Hsp15 [Fusobacterium necrophorum BFTR-2]|nr:RNA-binding S4 domain-containing protein [Fusobacterium necrophorum]KDE69425.1 heat-shock protein Hsp15 [Fusobacterium necrophorum BFTR-2]
MRLDKFLKVSRIIKRRTIAKMVVDEKKAKLDGKTAKASTEVKVGQELELEYFNKYFKFKILQVPLGNVQKEKTSELVKLMESRGIEKNFSLDTAEEFFENI